MLYIVATPIGNLEDITLRALRVLKEVDLILAEDTRKTGQLLKHFAIQKTMESFYEHNERGKMPRVIEELKQGKNIALVSNAGVPTISDPGYKLIRECRRQSIAISSLPGASSVINALALSSLPRDKFVFFGYFLKKASGRRKQLQQVYDWGITAVFLESPFRLLTTLNDIKTLLGKRQLTIAREMTKKFEEVLELSADEAITHFTKKKPKGEFTIVIGPAA